MKKGIIFFLTVLNILIMNAQELTKRDKTNPIQLTDKLSIYQEVYKEDKFIYWKLYLEKIDENEPKLLELYRKEEINAKSNSLIPNDLADLLNQDNYMRCPNLINAYMEGKYLYVFVYKDHKAMLEIYHFTDGIKFEKTGYLLYPIESGSVMNFGGYGYSVNIRKIGEFHYVYFGAWRDLLGPGKFGLLRIKENNIEEIKIEEVSEKSIAYPYIIKELNEDISEDEKKDILFKEFKKQLKANNLLAPNALIHSAGYIEDIINDGNYYIFYKTTDEPNKINLIRYGRYYIKHKPYWGWVFCDYTEEVLAPAYSHWNPK